MSYFDKFIKDLEKKTEEKKKVQNISEQENAYQEKRRLRVRRYQEKWQNSVKYTPRAPSTKK